LKKTLLLIACFLAVIAFNYAPSFAQITLPYQQKFDLQNFPPFWSQTSTISPRWSISPTANADGTPNEMMATGTTGTGVSRLIVGPINTTGLTSLNLQFKQVMSCTDTLNFALRIQSSVNGTNWTNESYTLDENNFNCSNTINTTINNNVGSTTYIAWLIAGNHSQFDNWFIDDIIIGGSTQNDVGIISSILSPRDKGYNVLMSTTVKNNSSIAQSFSIQVTIFDGYSSTKLVSNLNPGAMYKVNFDEWSLIDGVYTATVCTQLPGDQNPLNDCVSVEFVVPADTNSPKFQTSVSVNNNWNLVSAPGFHPDSQHVDTWWPGRDPTASVYKYENGYQIVYNGHAGFGYWMKNSGNQIYNTGDEWPARGISLAPHTPIVVNTGWNLIGGYESGFPTENIFSIPPDIISAPVYGYSGGYGEADTLIPGYGYWVKISSTGLLMIDTSCTATPPQSLNKSQKQTELFKKDWGKIIITDAAGQSYTLYSVTTQEDLSRYELPPLPPAGVFDIRYSSGKIAEDISASQSIEMSGVVYPVKIQVENMHAKFTDGFSNEFNKELIPGEELIIYDNQINKLIVQSSHSSTPVKYSLDQNFPNPFNPVTTIKFSIANSGVVTLKVFDILGREVATLLNEEKPAGNYEVEFNASELASGIYFYKLQSGNYVETKKMILMK
jgi:hypothetical protein